MKKKKVIKINIILPNKLFYVFVAIGILIIAGVGVFAYNSGGPANFVGHSLDELNLPICSNGQVLGVSGGIWSCVTLPSAINLNGWSFSNDILLDDNEQVIKTNDEWLRLNQEGHFSSGIYTPGKLRADNGIYVGDDEYFYRSVEDVIKTGDSFISEATIQGAILKITGSTVTKDSSCLENQIGEIRRCTIGNPSVNQLVCVCDKHAGTRNWRDITGDY